MQDRRRSVFPRSVEGIVLAEWTLAQAHRSNSAAVYLVIVSLPLALASTSLFLYQAPVSPSPF